MISKWIMAVANELKKFNFIKNIQVNCGFDKFDDKEMDLIITTIPEDTDFLRDKEFYTDYAYDILNTYFESELNRILISGKNHQNIRTYLIGIMKWYSKYKNYAKSTIHLAVLYLDVYMDSFILSSVTEHQKFVALVVLLLAVKTEEIDENVPSIKDLLQFVDLSEELGIDLRQKEKYEQRQVSVAYKSYLKLYCTLEFMVFQTLKFNTIRPTAMSFLLIFQKIAVTEDDMREISQCEEYSVTSMDELRYFVNYYLKMLSEVVLYDISFNQYLPSKVAAAIIGTTRKMLNIKTVWNLQLEFLTQSSFEEIEPIMKALSERLGNMEDITVDDNSDIGDSGFHSNDLGMDSIDLSSSCDLSEDEHDTMGKTKKFKAESDV